MFKSVQTCLDWLKLVKIQLIFSKVSNLLKMDQICPNLLDHLKIDKNLSKTGSNLSNLVKIVVTC